MRPTRQEFAHPREWLARLATEPGGYRRLVSESGGTGRAAYRIARATCAAEPCLEDLQAAAAILAAELGSEAPLPIRSLLPPKAEALPTAPPLMRRGPALRSRPRASRAGAAR